MKLFVLQKKTSGLQALGASLLTRSDAGAASARPLTQGTLERIRTLNPHVDFQQLDAGTVLVLPDSPEVDGTDSQILTDTAFADFAIHVNEGLRVVSQRARDAAEVQNADRTAVATLLKTAVVRRQIESDALLIKQLDLAQEESANALKQAQEDIRQLEKMQKDMSTELKAIGKIFGLLK
jgi:hypothetical protein